MKSHFGTSIDEAARMSLYLIWNREREMWWGANSVGYVDNVHEAGRYTYTVAASIAVTTVPPGSDIAVPEGWALRAGPPT